MPSAAGAAPPPTALHAPPASDCSTAIRAVPAGARPETHVPRYGLVLLPAGCVAVERVDGGAAAAPQSRSGGGPRRAPPGSAPQSPFVAHAIRPSLEHRVREAARVADLEELVALRHEFPDATFGLAGGRDGVPGGRPEHVAAKVPVHD